MIDELRLLKTCIKTGNLTKAAMRSNTTQPAASSAIKRLELKLGCNLLKRSRAGVAPTSDAQQIMPFIDAILLNYDRMLSDIAIIKDEPAKVKIGVIDGAVSSIKLALALHTPPSLYIEATSKLEQMLLDGQLDFAVVTKPALKQNNLKYTHLTSQSMVTVVFDKSLQTFKPSDLIKRGIIAYNQDSATFAQLDLQLRRVGVPNYVAYSSSPDVMLSLVAQGFGSAIVPLEFVQIRKKFYINPNITLNRELVVAEVKGIRQTKAAGKFLQQIYKFA